MRTAAAIVAMLLAAGTGAAPGDAEESAGQPPSGARLSARDHGGTVRMRVGHRFTVSLRANPSTGYSWQVASSGEPVLRQLGEPTFVEDSRRAGAGGTLTFSFRAEQAGTAALQLVYVRPWEKGKEPADTFAVTVVVTK